MNQKQASKMLTLAYFLKTQVPSNRFEMGSWLRGGLPSTILENHDCETVACAAGYCAALFPDEWYWIGISRRSFDWPMLFECGGYGDTYDSLSTFFGITCDEAWELFGPVFDRTPEQEAKILEDFVEQKGYVYAD